MKKRLTMALAAGALVAAMLPGVASADVVTNPDGSITVGKGDVQGALGWDNKELQRNAENLAFRTRVTVESTVEYACDDGKTYTQTATSLNDSLYKTYDVVRNPADKATRFALGPSRIVIEIKILRPVCPDKSEPTSLRQSVRVSSELQVEGDGVWASLGPIASGILSPV
jgi:hypothetical protein